MISDGKTLILIFFLFFNSYSFTKEEISANIEANQINYTFPFEAKIKTQVTANGKTLIDTGVIFMLPPECYRIEMFNSKTVMSAYGDTVEMKVGGQHIVKRVDSVNQALHSPTTINDDFLKKILENDFNIIEHSHGIKLEININGQRNNIILNTDTWLIKEIASTDPNYGNIRTIIEYQKINGTYITKSIVTEHSYGRMIATYSDVKVNESLSKSFFKLTK